MTTITIQPTQNIPPHILALIKKHSPRDGLRNELGNEYPTDTRVQCARENYACYIMDGDNLVSFAILAHNENFTKNIAEAMNLDPKVTATGLYLFTVLEYQKK